MFCWKYIYSKQICDSYSWYTVWALSKPGLTTHCTQIHSYVSLQTTNSHDVYLHVNTFSVLNEKARLLQLNYE